MSFRSLSAATQFLGGPYQGHRGGVCSERGLECDEQLNDRLFFWVSLFGITSFELVQGFSSGPFFCGFFSLGAFFFGSFLFLIMRASD
jgi:hypothetical protein